MDFMHDVQLHPVPDSLGWSLDISDSFLVSSACCDLDSGLAPSGDMVTRWNNWVPIKLNILFWRVQLNNIRERERDYLLKALWCL